jgi:fused signal recognition particle receptor
MFGDDVAAYLPWIAVGIALVAVALGLGLFLRRRPALPGPTAAEPLPTTSGFRAALQRTRDGLASRLGFAPTARLDAAAFEALEEALLSADVGPATTEKLLAPLRERARAGLDGASLPGALRDSAYQLVARPDVALTPANSRPWVILVVGVNGSGKTTTIGKLATRLSRTGRKVLLAAGDTYRAAAADQLAVWAERAGCEIVRQDEGADPGAVVHSALEKALARGHDVVIVDTAGRLQTKKPLMDQLAKLRRVIAKHVADGPHETLLVLDGTMGQNGLSQARLFHEATPLTGVVVTKLDGTAKGGMVLTISSEMNLPVKLVGLGEGVDDLADFDPRAFADALA